VSQKLIIFDMDGTLVNSSLTIANAINYVRQNLGFEPMSQEYILKRVNDHTLNPAQTFYHTRQFEPHHEQWFSEYYTKNHEQELVLYDGIKELLETLKAKECTLAVATNAYRGSTIESLSHLDIYGHFDAIACYDDEALFIGDGPRDEMASKKAEIEYIMVDWGFTDHSDAVRSVGDLHSILEQRV